MGPAPGAREFRTGYRDDGFLQPGCLCGAKPEKIGSVQDPVTRFPEILYGYCIAVIRDGHPGFHGEQVASIGPLFPFLIG